VPAIIFRVQSYGHHTQSDGQSNADSPNVEPHERPPTDSAEVLKHSNLDFVPIAAGLLNFLHLLASHEVHPDMARVH
jgi:hypothetical protein